MNTCNGLFQPTAEELLEQVADWTDPHPKPVVVDHEGFLVVRDDLLGYGSKARFIDKLVRDTDCDEWVYGGATKTGWGPISLGYACRKYGKKATIFAPTRRVITEQQQKAIDFDVHFEWQSFGMLNVCESRARKYHKETSRSQLLPIGLEHPWVFGSIIKVARDLDVEFSEIWTAAGSGTLSRGLQLAFPDKPVIMVQIGHKLSEREIGRAKLHISPYKYDQAVRKGEEPPFPSEKFYDAKTWKFIREFGKKSALLWNVAG